MAKYFLLGRLHVESDGASWEKFAKFSKFEVFEIELLKAWVRVHKKADLWVLKDKIFDYNLKNDVDIFVEGKW